MGDDIPSFQVSNILNDLILVKITRYNYDPFLEWMPFIDWDTYYIESYPMQTEFKIHKNELDKVIKILQSHGYVNNSKLFIISKF